MSSRNAPRTAGSLLAIGAAAAMVALTGCGSSVAGSPEATPSTTQAPSATASDLTALLLTPDDFPAPYDAIVLPQQAISQAAPDLSGIPAGAQVQPAGCKPADQDFGPNGTALIVGTDNANRSTISIELIAASEPLSVREAQIEECGRVEATKSGATSIVTSTLTPAPPIDADDTYAVRQTVTSGAGTDSVTQSMLTLVAQIDDIRISATYMSFGGDQPDGASLDQLFTEAVQKVKAG